MSIFNNFPYTDFHELNLDWVIRQVLSMKDEITDWKGVSEIKFADPIEWDKTSLYQANTIVEAADGDSYISKKLVPSGIDLSSSEYWLKIGNYNAQVEGYRQEVEGYRQEVEGYRQEVEILKNKRIVMISDSYGDHGDQNWITLLPGKLSLSDGNYFGYAEPSGGFAVRGNFGHNFEELLQAHSNDISSHNTITDIIVCGGTNDFYYFSDEGVLATKISSFFEYAKSEYPNAKVWVSMVGNVKYKDFTMFSNLVKTATIYEQVTVSRGGCYMSGLTNIMHDAHNFDDSMHPNILGSDLIAGGVCAYLNGGDYKYISKLYQTSITKSGIVQDMSTPTQTISYIQWQICGDTTTFIIPRVDALFSSPQNLSVQPSIDVYEFDDSDMLLPCDSMYFNMVLSSVDSTVGSLIEKVQYKTSELYPTQPNGMLRIGGGTGITASNATLISIAQHTITVPTISL